MFAEAFLFTLQNEGKYSDDPKDPGGETKFGISKRAHPHLDIKNLTATEAKLIYFTEYWNPKYNRLPDKLSTRLFDIGVNIGVKRAVRILQSTLNSYFDSDLKVDGVFGDKTLKEARGVNGECLYSAFVFEVSLYYNSLNSPYFKGWLNRLYKNIT